VLRSAGQADKLFVMSRLIVLALIAATAGCASTGAIPRPFPGAAPAGSAGPATTTPGADTYAVTATALSLRGVPYRNGGADPAGFDCSGFVQYVYAQHGLALPRTVGQQFGAGARASGPLQPGDLVFFSTVSAGASHVGIALGGDEFVHAPSSAGEVRVERVSSSYWSRRYIGARRLQ
jgi:cell wall-associated NlpC family hydrolase